jgi:D-psicose/D-tagatose/L-ribulose 3-epimerase
MRSRSRRIWEHRKSSECFTASYDVIRFDQLFRALAQVGYAGPVTFETFSPDLLEPDFAGLLALWRPFYQDPDDLGRHAVEFIRNKLRAAQTVADAQAS